MRKEIHNDQSIAQYLLGSLPGAETERLDELSLTDDEFADSLKAAEKELVDAYVQGELSGAQLERFESHYLASPLGRQKVEFAQAFQLFAEANSAAQDPAFAIKSRAAHSAWSSILSVFKVPRLAVQWGLAAAAAILLIGGFWLAFENLRLRREISATQARSEAAKLSEQQVQNELERQRTASVAAEQELARVRAESERLEQEVKKEQERRTPEQREPNQLQPSSPGGVSIATFVLSPQMRSAEQPPTVSIPPKIDYVSMQLNLEPDDHPAYRAALMDLANQQTLWRSGELKARGARDGKTISVKFPAALLRPQAYLVRLTGVSPNGAAEIISDYPFRVVSK